MTGFLFKLNATNFIHVRMRVCSTVTTLHNGPKKGKQLFFDALDIESSLRSVSKNGFVEKHDSALKEDGTEL